MPLFAVTAIGADRPGIVARVTGVLVDHGCNLEDTSMSILRGHFAMVLIVAAPADLAPGALEAALAERSTDLGLVVAVRAVGDGPASPESVTTSWTVVVYGADHPGIVHGVAALLADLGVSVVDLTTRVTGGAPPIYSMVIDVAAPPDLDGGELDQQLQDLAARLGVSCTLHPSEADLL